MLVWSGVKLTDGKIFGRKKLFWSDLIRKKDKKNASTKLIVLAKLLVVIKQIPQDNQQN